MLKVLLRRIFRRTMVLLWQWRIQFQGYDMDIAYLCLHVEVAEAWQKGVLAEANSGLCDWETGGLSQGVWSGLVRSVGRGICRSQHSCMLNP